MRLEGKIALVVGGGSGMGRAGATAMAAEGAKVVVSDLSLDRAEAVAAAIGENASAMHVDVTSPELVERVVAETVERFGRLDILPVPTPEQIAPFVVYLASDESIAVTGTVFPIDAGYMAFKAQVDVMGTMQAGY